MALWGNVAGPDGVSHYCAAPQKRDASAQQKTGLLARSLCVARPIRYAAMPNAASRAVSRATSRFSSSRWSASVPSTPLMKRGALSLP